MTCANCARAVERTLSKKVDGVLSANVNFADEHVTVEYDSERTDLEEIAAAVKKAGYKIILPAGEDENITDAEQEARNREMRRELTGFITGAVFAVPLFILSMGRDFSLFGGWSHAAWVNWLFFALATPVQFYTGFGFYIGGFTSIRNRSANMDVLVALGSSTAYVYSTASSPYSIPRRPCLF